MVRPQERMLHVLSIERALDVQAHAAEHKAAGLSMPVRFAVSGILAGVYIGVGVVLMVSTAGPLLAAGTGMHKLVSGLVFGAALTIVVFAGAELVTSSMMTLPQGVAMRSVKPGRATAALGFTFFANLVGSVIFGALIAVAGVLHANPAADAMLTDMLAGKAHESPAELFVRGVLCNVLVCVAIWMCARLTSDGPKIAVILLAILAFIASGFEHVVANMTTYTIGMIAGDPNATWLLFGGNLLWVGLGNLVGGAAVGLAYWFIGGSPRVGATATEPAVEVVAATESATAAPEAAPAPAVAAPEPPIATDAADAAATEKVLTSAH